MISILAKFRRSAGEQPDAETQVPEGLRVYAIGDIHGRMDLLSEMLGKIKDDLRQTPVQNSLEIFLGDYIDRGPDSPKVIEELMMGKHVCGRRICLKGNHEDTLLRFLEDSSVLLNWRNHGGLDTLFAYGVKQTLPRNTQEHERLREEFDQQFPASHRTFLTALPTSITVGDYFFAHAGVRPGTPLAEQLDEDLLWIRAPFLNSKEQFGKLIVHGHTPVDAPETKSNRINIDTRAYASGKLTCVVLENSDHRFLQTGD